MAEKRRGTPVWARLNLIVGVETTAKVDEARAALKRLGVFVSISSLFEIAVLELLKRRDVAEVLRKHGAKARRD